MRKTNFFVKHLKNINNFINNLLEKNLNKLNFKNLSFLLNNNKIILTFVALFVLFLSYLLLPTFYKQPDITKRLKNELQSKFDLNFKFSQNINYNFFPRPHFTILAPTIFYGEKEISKINKLKIFISLDNLFTSKNIKVKDLVFENANFNLNKKNYNFFLELIYKNFKEGDLIIKDSNIFFRDSQQEVLFINKILKMKYYYEPKELKNILNSDNQIFNIPFSLEMFLKENKKTIFSKIDVNLIKLKIENELNLKNENNKTGKSEFIFNKLKKIVDYRIENNSLHFNIYDKKDEPNLIYKGNFNFKPFYANIDGNIDKINLNYLFGSNAFIAELLKTEIFNHKNIDFKLNINADKIYNNVNFKNININSKIQDGLVDTDNTRFKWKNIVDFELSDSLIFVRDGELVLDGKLKININDYNEIYKYLLTPKNYRNKIKQIDLNFNYNFDKNIAELKDIKIDNKINQNVNKILHNVILKRDDLQNKIYFKKLLNEAIKSYSG